MFDSKYTNPFLLGKSLLTLTTELAEIHNRITTLQQEFLEMFMKTQIQAQNRLAQEVLDNGESLEDYRFYETNWFEGNVWNYKCWKEKNK